jgi:hypothetical protein
LVGGVIFRHQDDGAGGRVVCFGVHGESSLYG